MIDRRERVQPRIVPADQADCSDLDTVFGDRGGAAECRCQRYRLARGESFANTPVEERAERLREQTGCGEAGAPSTSGLLAYLGDEAVGWCAVAPRAEYKGLVRDANQTAWRGRQEDRSDPGIWAVTCVLTRAGWRGRGIATALVAATVDHARERGARALEAYPITVSATWGEEHPGPLGIYLAAGFAEVARPSKRRAVVRVEL
ncbi:GNAT family N-acetyltransferase [Mobilicoccus caccae]|uniref:N-acetyltransferase n=1 Tax=Mobilicoccus caccae TaxID=1859295 RepID=A0ABQ6IWT7_9MICO|nr:GNAT family N-acetyltransferase [Mobilicoccus caccae]GMA41745.1 N-acetyltransferase [Mobilicoccus caccae]